jgi:hypothetical protein
MSTSTTLHSILRGFGAKGFIPSALRTAPIKTSPPPGQRVGKNFTNSLSYGNQMREHDVARPRTERPGNCTSPALRQPTRHERRRDTRRDVTFSDMAQAPTILNSMIAAIEGDIKEVSAAQAQLGEFAEKINSSHKALITIQKVHRAMCMRNQAVKVDAEDRGTPTILERTGPLISR